MSDTKSAVTSHATPANGKKARKVAERLPRTTEAIALGQIENVIKHLTPEVRGRVIRAIAALHG